MTGFGTGEGTDPPFAWSWDIRSVNAKGLDLRIRVPDWIDGLEAALRKRLGTALGRGSVTVSLRLSREDGPGAIHLNTAALDAMIDILHEIHARAEGRGLAMAAPAPTQIAGMRGILDAGDMADDPATVAGLNQRLLADFDTVLATFLATRAQEGAGLETALERDLSELEGRIQAARSAAEARRPRAEQVLKAAVDRLVASSDAVSEERLAQELALLAVKQDVTEEIDRLMTHVAAARSLLKADGPVGRRFDFLMQEFNREANTLCAKSSDSALTAIGLDMKTLIDQLREQVQNVE